MKRAALVIGPDSHCYNKYSQYAMTFVALFNNLMSLNLDLK